MEEPVHEVVASRVNKEGCGVGVGSGGGRQEWKGKKKVQLTLLQLRPCRTWKAEKQQLNQTRSWKGETESKQKRIQLLSVCFCKWFSVRGKRKTILTCFPLYDTAASSQYLRRKSKRLLILLLMLINLLRQISTNTHLSFVCTSFHLPPFNLNRNSHHWLLLTGRITLAAEKQDDSQGRTVRCFPDRKETKAYEGFLISIRKDRWEIHYWGMRVEIFFPRIFGFND